MEITNGEWPARFTGVVFTNEFFDALPVDCVVSRQGEFREMRVDWRADRFAWVEGPPVSGGLAEYVEQYGKNVDEGAWLEINLNALRWLDEIAARLERGCIFTIDYGHTARELISFPRGTLIGYRRHVASEDVLLDPGERDITAHVSFTALQDHGARLGFETVRFETLARTLAAAGEPDGFAAALAAATPAERTAAAASAQDAAVRDGRDFPHARAAARGKAIKKAPISRGLGLNLVRLQSLFGTPLLLLLFLRSSLLLRGLCSFLGCVLHRLILPNIKIVRSEKDRNVIHI